MARTRLCPSGLGEQDPSCDHAAAGGLSPLGRGAVDVADQDQPPRTGFHRRSGRTEKGQAQGHRPRTRPLVATTGNAP
jgi:hypothetical protein